MIASIEYRHDQQENDNHGDNDDARSSNRHFPSALAICIVLELWRVLPETSQKAECLDLKILVRIAAAIFKTICSSFQQQNGMAYEWLHDKILQLLKLRNCIWNNM